MNVHIAIPLISRKGKIPNPTNPHKGKKKRHFHDINKKESMRKKSVWIFNRIVINSLVQSVRWSEIRFDLTMIGAVEIDALCIFLQIK